MRRRHAVQRGSLWPAPGGTSALGLLTATLTTLLLAMVTASPPASAQQVTIRAGENGEAAVLPDGQLSLEVTVDLSQAGGLDVADLSLQISWETDFLSFVSAAPGDFGTVALDESAAATGQLGVDVASGVGATETFTALELILEPTGMEGTTPLTLNVLSAADQAGTDITASVAGGTVTVCVGELGLSGDVSGDGTINILDAQRIARVSSGLPVPDADRVAIFGDVNGDGRVNILDAQLIARSAVGLPTVAEPGRRLPGGCEGTDPEPPPPGGFTLSVTPSTVSLEQGGAATADVLVDRTDGFTEPVSLSVSNAPDGLGTTLDPNPVAADRSELTLTAASDLPAGTFELTITGSATGVDDATVTLTVQVQAPSPGGDELSLEACDVLWFAVKDGDAPWRAVPLSDGRFTFEVSSDRLAIAYVEEQALFRIVQMWFGVFSDLPDEVSLCPLLPTDGKTISGDVAGISDTDIAFVALGRSTTGTTTTAQPPGSFTLRNVPEGPQTLGAARRPDAQTAEPGATDRLVVRRDLDLPDGATLQTIDFEGPEAFSPVDGSVTPAGMNGDQGHLQISFNPGGQGVPFVPLDEVEVSGDGPVPGLPIVPPGERAAEDRHGLILTAERDPDSRTLFRSLANPDGATLQLGPFLMNVEVTLPPGTVVRPRVRYQRQPEYTDFFAVDYTQQLGFQSLSYGVSISPSYLGGQDIDLRIPDLTMLEGWQSQWNLQAGVPIGWSFSAIEVEGELRNPTDLFRVSTVRVAETEGQLAP